MPSEPHQRKRQVVLVDDHSGVRRALKQFLELYPDIEVIAEAADGEQAVILTGRHRPHVVVMDINMPNMNGVEATLRIKQAWPHIVVIGLSVECSRSIQEAIVAAGAVTLLHKEVASEHLYPLIKDLLPDFS